MRRRSWGWSMVLACLTVAAPLALAQEKPKPAPSAPPPKTPATCAQVGAFARAEAYGYKHVVTLVNGCDKAVECQVWTDVDPTPRVTLSAAPGETAEAITRVGSPAREVLAHKECRFR